MVSGALMVAHKIGKRIREAENRKGKIHFQSAHDPDLMKFAT